MGFGLAVYKFELLETDKKEELHRQMELYSNIFCVLDSLSTIFLQGVLLIIPYIWYTAH